MPTTAAMPLLQSTGEPAEYTPTSEQMLVFLLVATCFTTIFVPILLATFAFSRPGLRRKPIFILNVVTILLCLALGVVATSLQVRHSYIYSREV